MSIPVALEVFVPTVAEALLKISTTLPMWTNVVEKILAIRYDERRMLLNEMREMMEMRIMKCDSSSCPSCLSSDLESFND